MRLLIARISGLIVFLAVGTSGPLAAPLPPAQNHPIVGIWRLALPEARCAEVYRFRPDGTTLVTSAEEVSESEYQIPAEPSPKGFYRLTDTVVKDNGKQDCAGEIMKVGSKATHFILFHPSGALFLMCADESMETCIGPFHRVFGQGA